MSRTERLLDLLQTLRCHRLPVSGHQLAAETGISLRTLYRDIATLQAQGADIQGEPGVGYVLKPGFMLAPLMFSVEELEALVLGSRWVAERSDPRLGEAALNALAKIAAVLPPALREELHAVPLLVGRNTETALEHIDFEQIRRAIRQEQKLEIFYRDDKGAATERIIWPFAVGFFERVRVLMAWCELRQNYRHFRTDRIASLTLGERYPRRRHAMLKEWRALHAAES